MRKKYEPPFDDFWYESYNDPKIKKQDEEEEELMEEIPDVILELEDIALEKRKVKLPKIHGITEKRYIP